METEEVGFLRYSNPQENKQNQTAPKALELGLLYETDVMENKEQMQEIMSFNSNG